MTLYRRLTLLIGTALLSLMVLWAINYYQAGNVYRAADYSNQRAIPSLVSIAHVSAEMGRVRANLYREMILEDAVERESLAQKIRAQHVLIDEGLEAYGKLIDSADDRRLREEDRGLVDQYFVGAEKIIADAKAGDHKAGIADLLALYATGLKLSEHLEAHIQNNVAYSKTAADAALAVKANSVYVSMALLVLVSLILAFQGFTLLSVLSRKLAAATVITEKIAGGDFRPVAEDDNTGADEVGKLLSALAIMRARLASTLTGMATASESVLVSATDLAGASEQTARTSEQQTRASAQAAGALEQLTAGIEQVSISATEVSRHAQASRDAAERSGEAVQMAARQVADVASRIQATAGQVGKLSNDVQEIDHITVVIREVAEQTNLLALNAAIEAARAGEQGRGFAVVADEVRKLAERTSQSVNEITRVIRGIQEGSVQVVESISQSQALTDAVVTTAQTAGAQMHEIVQSADTLHKAIDSISQSLAQQRSASSAASGNVEAVAQTSTENAAAITSMSSTARQLRNVSDELKTSVSRFRM